jgi:rhodanese-related sulfurtransferase
MSSAAVVSPEQTAATATAALLVDVRDIDEWLAGHVDGAVHVPLIELPRRLDELPRESDIICICRSGNRSGQATAFLIEQGFRARNMVGGMKAWAAAGLPVERLDGSAGMVI